jgi:hypothetical protein
MKKIFQLIIFTMVALLATSLFIGCMGEESKGELREKEEGRFPESLPKEWEWYENGEWGFRIGYPRDCEINEEKEIAPTFPNLILEFKKPLDESKEFFRLGIDVSILPSGKKGKMPYQLAEETLQLVKVYDPKTKIYEFKNSTLGGESSIRLVAAFTGVKQLHEI